jgi:heme a synthase
MVRSGLRAPANEHDVPRVSPYRLAAHLLSAFAIYSTLVWTTMTLSRPHPTKLFAPAVEAVAMTRLHRVAVPISLLIALTAVSGAQMLGHAPQPLECCVLGSFLLLRTGAM